MRKGDVHKRLSCARLTVDTCVGVGAGAVLSSVILSDVGRVFTVAAIVLGGVSGYLFSKSRLVAAAVFSFVGAILGKTVIQGADGDPMMGALVGGVGFLVMAVVAPLLSTLILSALFGILFGAIVAKYVWESFIGEGASIGFLVAVLWCIFLRYVNNSRRFKSD